MLIVDLFFIITFFLFISYFIIISYFGFAISFFFKNTCYERRITLSLILKRFSIGLCFHILYSIIIVSLQIFNFFTVYLPFVIIDIGFLTYFLKKKNFYLKFRIQNISWNKIIDFFKKYATDILTLIVIFFMLYTLQMYFIWRRLAFPSSDPFFWFKNIWFVHENGAINYEYIEGYTPGYVLFVASMISITDNYFIVYYFCKYIPIFLSAVNILVLFEISKKLFKKRIYVFFTLSIYLSMSYLFYRYQMLLPSTLATTLGFLFLLFLRKGAISNLVSKDLKLRTPSLKNINKHDKLYRGLILAGIFMAHPLYGVFFLLFYFLYEIYIFIITIKLKRKILLSRTSFTIKFFVNMGSLFLIFIIMLFPWLIGASIYLDYPLYSPFQHYIAPSYLYNPLNGIIEIGKFFFNLARNILYQSIYYEIDTYIMNDFFKAIRVSNLNHFYRHTMEVGIIFIVIGILLPFNRFFNFNEKQKNIIRFIKFTFVLSVFLYIFRQIINLDALPFFTRIDSFLKVFLRRLFELFAGYWAIIFVLSFYYFIFLFKKIFFKFRASLKYSKNRIRNKIFSINIVMRFLTKLNFITQILKKLNIKKREILSIPIIISVIIISGFFYTTNYGNIYYYNHFPNSHTDAVIFAGNYFNENPLEEETAILVKKIEGRFLYDLIVFDNLKIIYYKFYYGLNYTEFRSFYEPRNISYALFNIKYSFEEFKANLTIYFEILYRNEQDWIFAKLNTFS